MTTVNYPLSNALKKGIVTDLTKSNQLAQAYTFLIQEANTHPVTSPIMHVNILHFMWNYEVPAYAKSQIIGKTLANSVIPKEELYRFIKPEEFSINEYPLTDVYSIFFKAKRNKQIPMTPAFEILSLDEIDTVLRNANEHVKEIYEKVYPKFTDFAKDALMNSLSFLTNHYINTITENNDERNEDTVFDYLNDILSERYDHTLLMVPYRRQTSDVSDIDFVLVIEEDLNLDYHIRKELIPYMESQSHETFFILKPDAIEKGIVYDILKEAETVGLTVKEMKRIHLNEHLLNKHYKHLRNKAFYPNILQYMMRNDCYIGIFEGFNAVNKWRQLLGDTNPANAEPHTIRARFGNHETFENVAHGSDSKASAEYEINLWF